MRSLGILVLILAVAVGCKKSKPTHGDTDPPPAPKQNAPSGGGGAGNVGIIPSPVAGGIVANPGALGGGGGGGAIQAVRKAARRTQALNEMKNLGLLIQSLQDDFGKMPTKERILSALKSPEYASILTGINEGAYILTGTSETGGLWAYEVDADRQAGIALIGGVSRRTTPDEVAPYLRNN